MIIIPAQVEGINTRKDSSLKITLGTQELTPEKAGQLFNLLNDYAYIAIKKEDFSNDELDSLESLNADEISKKTPSQRMRSCMYVLYTKNGEGYEKFRDFYEQRMEKFINMIKGEIEQFD